MTFGLLKKFSIVSPIHPFDYNRNSLTRPQNPEKGECIPMGVSNGFKIRLLAGHLLEFTSNLIGNTEGCQFAVAHSPLLTGPSVTGIPCPALEGIRSWNFGYRDPPSPFMWVWAGNFITYSFNPSNIPMAPPCLLLA
jgi:hypothetical protein